MTTSFITKGIAVVVIIAALSIAQAARTDATQEIEKVIRDYLKAMSARNIKGLQEVLDKRFVAVEAAAMNARVHLMDTANGKALLPPEGNDDWDKDKLKLSSIKAEISASHPSVAVASFTLTFPLTNKRVTELEAALKQAPAEFDEAQKQAAAKIISDRAIHNSMFAMLARQDGKWKIVCMSFPK
jgi:hypothetical protein